VSGGGATVSDGTQTASITITEYALNLQTAFVEGTSSQANANKALDNWENVGHYDSNHPYELMNLDKVWAYKSGSTYLKGSAQTIGIIDGWYFEPAIETLANKTIAYFDEAISNYDNTSQSGGQGHGNHVASIAAGYAPNNLTGNFQVNIGSGNDASESNGSTIGVAPEANLYYATYYQYRDLSDSYTYKYDALTAIVDAMNSAGVEVINNSWGYVTDIDFNGGGDTFQDYMLTTFNTLASNNPSFSNAQLLSYIHNNYWNEDSDSTEEHTYSISGSNSDTSSAAETSVNNFVTSLTNYMTNTGVIVWANTNTNAFSVDTSSGLPYLFTGLQKAWITVTNVDVSSSTINSSTVSRISGSCGLAGPWCLSMDGTNIYAPTWDNNGTTIYMNWTGTSMASPMVSGAVAILSQAFPNHTPEQIVDRLLASANNTFFTHDANLTFSNEVYHGYDDEYGHGIMDLYAALAPILSDNFSRSVIYTGSSTNSQSQEASSSSLRLGSSFGRSVSNALSEEVYYYYDALDGGFEASLSNIISYQSTATNLINQLQSDILRLDSTVFEVQEKSYNYSFGNVLGTMGNKDTNLFSISIDTPSAPIQYFNKLNSDNAFGLASFNNPFVDSTNGGIGISSEFNYGDKKIMLGFHDSSLRSGLFGESEQEVKTLAVAMSSSSDNFANFTLLAGLMIEEDTLLDSKGSGALGFHGTNPHSLFAGVNFEKIISNDLSVKFVSTVGYSTLDTPVHSLIGEVSPITSSSFNLILNKYHVMHDRDRLSVSIGQPNRVETGTMTFRIPELADSEGNLTYANREIDLNPSGRQIDFGIDYVTKLDNDLILGFKHTLSKDFNHIDSSVLNNTFTFTAKIDF
jgi:hypothetical protein